MTTPQPKDRRNGGFGSARSSRSLSCSFTSPFSPAAKLAISTRLPPALPVFDEAAPEGFTIVVGDLELGARLAEGAYGVVWRGGYSGLDVAIKVQSVPAEDYEQVRLQNMFRKSLQAAEAWGGQTCLGWTASVDSGQ
jgi:hypothetical protein